MPIILMFTLFTRVALPGQARLELRGWAETPGAARTADTFILSWLARQPYTASLLADAATVAADTPYPLLSWLTQRTQP